MSFNIYKQSQFIEAFSKKKIPEALLQKSLSLEWLKNLPNVVLVQKSAKTIWGGFPSLEPKLPAW